MWRMKAAAPQAPVGVSGMADNGAVRYRILHCEVRNCYVVHLPYVLRVIFWSGKGPNDAGNPKNI